MPLKFTSGIYHVPDTNGAGDGSNPQNTSTTVGSTVNPQSNVSMDTSEVNKQLDAAQSAYRGMQRNYNTLFSDTQAKDAKLTTMEDTIAQLQSQLSQLTNTNTSTKTELQNTSVQVDTLSTEATIAKREADMYRVVAREYPELGGILETLNVTPRETPEATKEMLKGLSDSIKAQAAKMAKVEVGSYNGGPVGAVSGELSIDALREKAVEAAGGPEYDKWSKLYYGKVQESGEYPKPRLNEIDKIMHGVQ